MSATEAGGDTGAAKTSTKKSIKAAKPAPQHPTYKEMVSAAVTALKDRKGISRQAVSKYIKTNYQVKGNCDNHVNGALVKGVSTGALIQMSGTGASGRFKLAKAEKAAPKTKKAVAKKAVKKAVKPKKAGKAKKKAAVKKSTKKVVKRTASAGKKSTAKKTPAKSARAKPKAKKTTKKPASKSMARKK